MVRFQFLLKDSEEALQGKGDLFWVGCSFCNRIRKNPGDSSGKEPACQSRRQKRCRFDPWVGKIPWRRSWQPIPVFLPGESHGQRSLLGYKSIGSHRVRHN